MSNLVSLNKVSLAYGLDPLLDKANLHISAGERVCLIGRNGTGKSSLLKIIAGEIKPDGGTIYQEPGLRLAVLSQNLPQESETTVYEFVAGGLAELGQLLTEYHELILEIAHLSSPEKLANLGRLQHRLDAKNAWSFEQKITNILTRLNLPPDRRLAELSGGWQRRAALARALVSAPQLLLLDEPTNHLDIEVIQWLENELLASKVSLLFITHDRSLLRRLATRIIELDRSQLTSWPGDYDNFLRRKEEMLHAEAKQNTEFDKKLAQEERWIRQGIKARRTRNEGRVRALKAMRLERAKRRELEDKASFNLHEAKHSGQLVLEASHITHHFNNQTIIKDFSIRVMRGDRIGLIGPNGIGKSTLLNIMLGKLQPEQGKVTLGTQLQLIYFDQLRKALDPEKTVAENVVQGSDFIEINGKKQHIISYLSDFLFPPTRGRTPVKALSGGECNRLLLARLFSQPANLIVMDEPTNDLDLETLELLEELLSNFKGSLLLVSHDRDFLDNVVTSTLVFEGKGIITEYVGGYQDWLRQTASSHRATLEPKVGPKIPVLIPKEAKPHKTSKKLSYKEQKELSDLPSLIEKLEVEHAELQQKTATPDFYQQSPDLIAEAMARLEHLSTALEQAYQRWDTLEN